MLKQVLALLAMMVTTLVFASVDVNKATPAELDGIKGIGPGTADKIIQARKKGPFKDWNDLEERIPGIKEKRAMKLSEAGLTVNGASYPQTAPAPSAKKAAEKTAPASAVKPVASSATAAAPAPAQAASTVKK